MYEFYVKLRNARNVKDSDVARNTGIGRSTFSDWKSGRSEPKKDKLEKIGVPDQYIIGRHGWRTDYALKSIYRNELDDVAVKMNNRINSEFKRKFSKTDAHKNAHGKKKR